MPSPIAHAALAMLAPPALGRPTPALLAIVVVFLLLPDLDIAVGLVTTGDAFADHGSWSHSFLLAPLAGMCFAYLARRIAAISLARGLIVGTALYASHVALDSVSTSRGVGMLWPIIPERIDIPLRIFSGVRHSEPLNFAAHARTLAEEIVFVLVIAAIAWALARVRERTPQPAEASP